MAKNECDPNCRIQCYRKETVHETTAAKETCEIETKRIALQASLQKINSYIRSGMTTDIIKSVVEEECRKHGLCQEGK
jgi:hypothetical protein